MDQEHCNTLDDIDPSEPLVFHLYHIENHPTAVQSGSLNSYNVKGDSSAIYALQKSAYDITVERLLWVDGWEETTINNESRVHGREMTLVVLKIVLVSHDAKRKFGQAEVSLSFEDPNWNVTEGKNEPTIEAWAPFRETERWNASQAQYSRSDKKEGSLQFGYSEVGVSGSWAKESTVSWARMAFDQGTAVAQISRTTNNRNGVTWMLKQNDIENAGITQEFWAAVLLSRPTAETYRVKFQVNTRVGTKQDFTNQTKKFFGLDPHRTKPFLVTPWRSEVCNYEGRDIKKCIDIDNLGKLRDQATNSRLNVKWGPDYRTEVSAPSIDKQDYERGDGSLGSNKAAQEHASPAPFTTGAISVKEPEFVPSSQQEVPPTENTINPHGSARIIPGLSQAPQWGLSQVSQLSLPPLVIGWQNSAPHSSTTDVDFSRVTGLEARMAQLETRLARQDTLILQLQHALLNQKI